MTARLLDFLAVGNVRNFLFWKAQSNLHVVLALFNLVARSPCSQPRRSHKVSLIFLVPKALPAPQSHFLKEKPWARGHGLRPQQNVERRQLKCCHSTLTLHQYFFQYVRKCFSACEHIKTTHPYSMLMYVLVFNMWDQLKVYFTMTSSEINRTTRKID